MQTYTVGCYYLNSKQEEWVSDGLWVKSTTKTKTVCAASHLTSFATGFFPEVNTIDFELVFAAASFEDNLTAYVFLIIVFTLYVIWMIWALYKDRQDAKRLVVPSLADNHPEDRYFYEMLVETGPLSSHGTTANVFFLLDGDGGDTGERCLRDFAPPAEDGRPAGRPPRTLFQSAETDSFLLATQHALGDLNFIRVWTDSTGIYENGSWYLLGITVRDVQTGRTTRFVADQWLACDMGTFEDDIVIVSLV